LEGGSGTRKVAGGRSARFFKERGLVSIYSGLPKNLHPFINSKIIFKREVQHYMCFLGKPSPFSGKSNLIDGPFKTF
jgi:hypothetical protein